MKTIDAQAEWGQIRHIVEPYAWALDPAVYRLSGRYELRGIVNTDAPEILGAEAPTVVRAALLARFEQMLDALIGQGWQLVDRFTLEFTTGLRNFTQTLAGELVVPSEQYGIALKFDLTVDRPR